ncbi:MAG: hypothetical protein M1561_05000 [Gammaproteobacteria bacterium]|nr:hypothetical protein [Gammaproteobacteria bacterium]
MSATPARRAFVPAASSGQSLPSASRLYGDGNLAPWRLPNKDDAKALHEELKAARDSYNQAKAKLFAELEKTGDSKNEQKVIRLSIIPDITGPREYYRYREGLTRIDAVYKIRTDNKATDEEFQKALETIIDEYSKRKKDNEGKEIARAIAPAAGAGLNPDDVVMYARTAQSSLNAARFCASMLGIDTSDPGAIDEYNPALLELKTMNNHPGPGEQPNFGQQITQAIYLGADAFGNPTVTFTSSQISKEDVLTVVKMFKKLGLSEVYFDDITSGGTLSSAATAFMQESVKAGMRVQIRFHGRILSGKELLSYCGYEGIRYQRMSDAWSDHTFPRSDAGRYLAIKELKDPELIKTFLAEIIGGDAGKIERTCSGLFFGGKKDAALELYGALSNDQRCLGLRELCGQFRQLHASAVPSDSVKKALVAEQIKHMLDWARMYPEYVQDRTTGFNPGLDPKVEEYLGGDWRSILYSSAAPAATPPPNPNVSAASGRTAGGTPAFTSAPPSWMQQPTMVDLNTEDGKVDAHSSVVMHPGMRNSE